MGKYLVRVESMDMNEKLARRLVDGIELDGLCIFGKNGDDAISMIHKMNVDGMSDVISVSDELMMAAILAKAKREICDIGRRKSVKDIAKLLGME